jgi:hypothetical protein
MLSKEDSENKSRYKSSVLIFIVSFLLLASIAVSVVGLLNGKNHDNEESKRESDLTNDETDKGSLTDLFDREFSERSEISDEDETYDPFKETCVQKDGGDTPAFSSFTFCSP